MGLNIPKSFDTKEVGQGQFAKRENIGTGRYDLKLDDVKFKEGRGGESYLIVEWTVIGVIEGTMHRVGDELQTVLDLGNDYAQVDAKVILATLLGPIAARQPAIEETKATTGKVVERKVRWAIPGDPNAIDSDALTSVCDAEGELHGALLGTKVNVKGYVANYTPSKGKNAGKEVSVTRYAWKLLGHTEAMAESAAAAQAEIDKMNAAFKASLETEKAA